MPDGTMLPITHQAVDDAQKTLGVVTCPSGNSKGNLLQMKKKTQKWLDSLTAGCLHRQMMWFSVDRQLWPLVKYGLYCSMATLPELETILLPFYGKMLPLGGIVHKANRGIRLLDHGFYGEGFPHPGVEATLEQSNKRLIHYGFIQPWVLSCKRCWNSWWWIWGYCSTPFECPMSSTENG
jgi:hypothetical protein